MTFRSLPTLLAFCVIGALLFGVSQQATTNSSGAPTSSIASNGHAGSPAENGRTCATSGCHNGPATAKDNMITIQGLPATGYVPGETYEVEVGTAEASTRWGFQATVQTPTGSVAGSLATRDNETRLTQVNGYITHTTQGNSGTNSKSWSFDWTAPSAGTGDVGVYVAINASNANGSTNGDNILFDELTIPEGQPTGVDPVPAQLQIAALQMTGQQLIFTMQGHTQTSIDVEVYSMNGQQVASKTIGNLQGQATVSLPVNASTGIYILRLRSASAQLVQKVVAL